MSSQGKPKFVCLGCGMDVSEMAFPNVNDDGHCRYCVDEMDVGASLRTHERAAAPAPEDRP